MSAWKTTTTVPKQTGYKLIASDLDDTLAVTKQPITPEMASLLAKVLDTYDLCVISGGTYEQIITNVVTQLKVADEQLARIHVMSTSGARYDRYDPASRDWKPVYEKTLSGDERANIIRVVEQTIKQTGLWEAEVYGDRIDDRGSQITFSGLGQLASPSLKAAWDPSGEKRRQAQAVLAEALPGYEVVINGKTSIDVLQPNIDKAYGIQQLVEREGYALDEILFFGDSLEEHGNDYPVKALGVASIEVKSWQDTANYIRDNLI